MLKETINFSFTKMQQTGITKFNKQQLAYLIKLITQPGIN